MIDTFSPPGRLTKVAQIAASRAATIAPMAADLAEVALMDAPESAAVGKMKPSWWYEKVRAGLAPQPVIRAPRCTRWRRSEVIEFWRKFAEQPGGGGAAVAVQASALKASASARAVRVASKSATTSTPL